MKAVILGGSGFIGTHLANSMLAKGWHVTIPSRSPEKGRFLFPEGHSPNVSFRLWSETSSAQLTELLEGTDVVVNLAGENIGDGRWSATKKKNILSSRVQTTQTLMSALRQTAERPAVLIQGSAVGFYGGSQDHMPTHCCDEDAQPGKGFLAEVTRQWEAASADAEALGLRRVLIRTGVVLGADGGALQKFLPPFRLYLGGPLGKGTQGFSWIHIEDQVEAIIHLIEDSTANGPFNLTAPSPTTMSGFCKALGRAMHRPSWLPAPSFALQFLLGEMATELILKGQYALPAKLLEHGYTFRYPKLDTALQHLLTTELSASD